MGIRIWRRFTLLFSYTRTFSAALFVDRPGSRLRTVRPCRFLRDLAANFPRFLSPIKLHVAYPNNGYHPIPVRRKWATHVIIKYRPTRDQTCNFAPNVFDRIQVWSAAVTPWWYSSVGRTDTFSWNGGRGVRENAVRRLQFHRKVLVSSFRLLCSRGRGGLIDWEIIRLAARTFRELGR